MFLFRFSHIYVQKLRFREREYCLKIAGEVDSNCSKKEIFQHSSIDCLRGEQHQSQRILILAQEDQLDRNERRREWKCKTKPD